MVEVTIGQVAGIIAAGLIVVQIVAPLILAYILLGALRDSETATTWSLVNQRIQATLWPNLLRQESVKTTGVRAWIRSLSSAFPLLAILSAVAGIVTPLGLGEKLERLAPRGVDFEYVADTSPFQLGTSPRGVVEFSRFCNQAHGLTFGPIGCPYTGDVVTVDRDSISINYTWDNSLTTQIPDELREIFGSGTRGERSTVANFFDIEWRQLSSSRDDDYDDGKPYGVGIYRQLDSFILENSYHVVEGLVVDTKLGGIGFRNHTIPVGLSRGGTWQEDLLFIEPESACVNTNLTFDFEIAFDRNDTGIFGISNLRLTDRGGFVNLNQEYPEYDRNNSQRNPDLLGRAYKGAFLNNGFTMMVLNVTNPNDEEAGISAFSYLNSELGKSFPVPSAVGDKYTALGISPTYGNYLRLSSFTAADDVPDYPNPFDITADEFRDASLLCNGAGNNDLSNITNIFVLCGLLRGAPKRTDGGYPSLLEHGSQWSSPLHSCASAVRASIKTVTFTYNGTEGSGLSSLVVEKIEPKEYASEEEMPLWGMEDSGLAIDAIRPVWGLIAPEYAAKSNVSSVRQPHFYLPGYSDPWAPGLGYRRPENLPGSDFPNTAMKSVYSMGELAREWPFDLTGTASMAIFSRWQRLSPNPGHAADIIKLMWTDVAASAVVGTKGALGSMNLGNEDEVVDIRVRPIGHKITYNYLYGIPAYILAIFVLVLLVTGFLSMCFGGASMHTLRRRYMQLSPGRIFATFLYPDQSNLTMPVARWMDNNGQRVVKVGVWAEADGSPGYSKQPLAAAADMAYPRGTPLGEFVQPGVVAGYIPFGERKA